ncbi:hypothetical protein ACJMK2_020064, partial [Sinanodonta woodiana]
CSGAKTRAVQRDSPPRPRGSSTDGMHRDQSETAECVVSLSHPTRYKQLKQHLQKCHPGGGRSSVIIPPCLKVVTKSCKEKETVKRIPYPFPNTKSILAGRSTNQPQERSYTDYHCRTCQPATHTQSLTAPHESALVPFVFIQTKHHHQVHLHS